MKKIAIINLSDYETWFKGGIMSYVNNTLPYFYDHYKKLGYDITVFGCTVDEKKPNPLYIDDECIEVFTYTNVKTHNKVIPNFIRSFFSILRNRKIFNDFDIVHSHTSATTLGIKLFCKNVFVVHHQHGLSYKNAVGHRKILNYGYTLAQLTSNVNFIVADEEDVLKHAKKLKKYTKAPFYSIGSPIYFDRGYKKIYNENNTPRFVYAGRIDDWKNTIMMVEAFLKYVKNANEKLNIYGDGPSFMKLKDYIESHNAIDKIILHGFVDNKVILEELHNYDIFLFPSKGEGMPLSILEAYAHGLPIVGFDVIGVRNLIVDKKTGSLVHEITADAFSKGIEYVSLHYKEMYDDCRLFAEQYDSKKVSDTIYNIIDKEYIKWKNK